MEGLSVLQKGTMESEENESEKREKWYWNKSVAKLCFSIE